MKLSVSLPDDYVAVLDEYAGASGLASRSAVVQYAIRLLRFPDLEQDYALTWEDWECAIPTWNQYAGARPTSAAPRSSSATTVQARPLIGLAAES